MTRNIKAHIPATMDRYHTNRRWLCVLSLLLLSTIALEVVHAGTNLEAHTLDEKKIKSIINRDFKNRFRDDAQDLHAERVIYFGSRSTDITIDLHDVLAKHTAYFNGHDNLLMLIIGYADERGTPSFNHELGRLRAQAVRTRVLEMGVAPEYIRVISFGEEHPLGTGEDALQKSRRVEIIYTERE